MDKSITGLIKTHHCGELRETHRGREVTLCGWVQKYRDLGGLHFVDLWDKEGLIQLAFDQFQGDVGQLKSLSLESVILVHGTVRTRPKEAQNPNLQTGGVEISVTQLKLLSPAQEVPFLPRGLVTGNEDFRLKHRYLDLRSKKLQNILKLRSQTARVVREALYREGFTEVETPILYKSTPEGARDYLVPSRVHPGKVYALPQSPQTLKQLLMIGGTDRYFQIAKCFRDEDLRADRQPEFTQIDIEAAFCSQEYIKNLATTLLQEVYALPENFTLPSITYDKAMELYGTDKPDTRFELTHQNATPLFANSTFQTFSHIARSGGLIKSLFLPRSLGELSRKDLDHLSARVKPLGGQGVAWVKVESGQMSGGIAKFSPPLATEEDGLHLFFAHTKHTIAHTCADNVRRHLGEKLHLIQKDERQFLWITDFPLLEYSEEDQRFYALHHPFTQPKKEDLSAFLQGQELSSIRADAYDLVLNGCEIAGGSMRIYDQKVQKKMFEILGFSQEEAKRQFGFFLTALKHGTPPHGGIAFGFDRMMMLLARTDHIRDVIAFPKTTSASDLMSDCPSSPNPGQLKELFLTPLNAPPDPEEEEEAPLDPE